MAVATAIKHVKYSDGNSVDINLTATVVKDQPALAEGWLGITTKAGVSGEMSALSIHGEYQFKVPHALGVAKGDVVRIDTTQVTGHTPADAAYNKSAASSTNRDFFRATMAQNSDDIVTGILLVGG